MNTQVTVTSLKRQKEQHNPISALAVYDYATACRADEAGVDILLVGDSLANTFMGLSDTLSVTVDMIAHHVAAVSKAANRAMVIADMPFLSYGVTFAETAGHAGHLIRSGAAGIKLEGPHCDTVRRLTALGIAVQGHLGIQPQSVHRDGGYKIQGRTPADAERLVQQALDLEAAGIFTLILEGVTAETAREVSSRLQIPVIGIGAGPDVDGQISVAADIMGLSARIPKHARVFGPVDRAVRDCFTAYQKAVKERAFPTDNETAFRQTN